MTLPIRTGRSMPVTLQSAALIACVLLLPVQLQTPIGMRFAPSDLFLALHLLLRFPRLRILKAAWSVWHTFLIMVFGIANLTTALLYGHLSRYVLLQKDLGLAVLFVGYLVFARQAVDPSNARLLLRWLLTSVFVQTIVAAVFLGFTFATGFEVSWMNPFSPRLSGLLIDPNAYGGLLVVCLAFHIATFYSPQPLIRGKLGLAYTFVFLVGIVLTFSRSAWIAVAAVIFVMGVLRPRQAFRLPLGMLLAVGVLLALFSRHDLSIITSMASRPSQIEARLVIIEDALEMFASRPVFGIGLGAYEEAVGVIVHNTPIWFLVEFGLVGFSVFAGFTLFFFVRGLRVYRLLKSEKGLVLGALLAHAAMLGLSMGVEALYQRHWWVVLAMLAACHAWSKLEWSRSQDEEKDELGGYSPVGGLAPGRGTV